MGTVRGSGTDDLRRLCHTHSGDSTYDNDPVDVGDTISSEIQESVAVQSAVRGGVGLLLLAFALILREGVELVLFTISLAVQDAFQTYVGVTIGLAIAIIIGVGLYHGSLRINLSGFFKWTSVFLVLFAAGMIAYGIHELQDAGLFIIGPMEVWNINPILDSKDYCGIMIEIAQGPVRIQWEPFGT